MKYTTENLSDVERGVDSLPFQEVQAERADNYIRIEEALPNLVVSEIEEVITVPTKTISFQKPERYHIPQVSPFEKMYFIF